MPRKVIGHLEQRLLKIALPQRRGDAFHHRADTLDSCSGLLQLAPMKQVAEPSDAPVQLPQSRADFRFVGNRDLQGHGADRALQDLHRIADLRRRRGAFRVSMHDPLDLGERALGYLAQAREIADGLRPDGNRHECIRFVGFQEDGACGNAAELAAQEREPGAAKLLGRFCGREKTPLAVLG